MSYMMEGYHSDRSAAVAPANERVAFIRRTYLHLAGAILAFAAIEAAVLSIEGIGGVIAGIFGHGFGGMLLLVAAFIGVSYVANRWAMSTNSRATQYAGLILYVVLEAFIFLPILWICNELPAFANQHLIGKAGLMTLAIFAGLTTACFVTGRDFSFLRVGLCVGGWVLLALLLGLALFGASGGILTLLVCLAGVALASGYIIYDTSNVIHHYRTDQHVAAALALFSSVALLFWYILRILMLSRNN